MIRSLVAGAVVLISITGCDVNPNYPDQETVDASNSTDGEVEGQVDFNDLECKKDGLLAVRIVNNSQKTIIKSNWSFSVFRKGYSQQIDYQDYATSGADDTRYTDKIINPGESFKVCSTPPRIDEEYADQELEYYVRVESQFQ